MATPRHHLRSGVGLDSRGALLAGGTSAVVPKFYWFRQRKKNHAQEQTIILEPKPEPLDRGEINESINKHGWISLPDCQISTRKTNEEA